MANTVVSVTIQGQDKASKAFVSVGKAAEKFGVSIETAGKRLESAGQAAGKFGDKLSKGVTLPLTAVAAISVKAAMEAGRFEQSLINLAGGADEAATYIDAIKRASRGTVSSMDAMAIASRALSFGVVDNAEQMEELTEVAITLGRAQGLTAAQAVGDLTTALSRQSPMILDNLGITLKLSEASDIAAEHAHEFGLASDDLTKAQQFQIAALVKGREVMEQLGGVQEDAAASAERLSAQLSDASVALGEQLLPFAVSAAEKLTALVASFNAMDESAQKTIVTMGGVAAAAGPALKAFSGIVKVAPGLGAGIGNVAAGFQLLAGGASAAQVASLGLAGTMAAAIPVVAALAAVLVAAKMAHDVAADAQERQSEVVDTWTQFLREQVDETESAVEMVEEYTAAQERVGDALESTSIIQGWFIDEQAAMNASSQDLAAAILEAATSYEDYRNALEEVGLGSAEVGVALDEMSFMMLKARRGAEEFSNYAGGMIEGVEDITQAATPATESLDLLAESSSSVARSFGEMTFDYETLWNLALASGASTEALAALAQSLGIATEAEIQHTLAGQRLVEQFGQGLITAEQLQEGFHGLATAQSVAAVQTANLEKEVRGAVQGVQAVASADEKAEVNALAVAEAEAAVTEATMARREQMGELSEGMVETEEATDDLTNATVIFQGSIEDVRRAEEETTDATDDMRNAQDRARGSMVSLTHSTHPLLRRMAELETFAIGIRRELLAIPPVIDVTVRFNTEGSIPTGGGGGGGGGGNGGPGPEPLQAGTLFAPGGLALVGETGPELVDLPRGARVFPAGQTQQMLTPGPGGAGGGLGGLTVNVYGASEPEASADAVVAALRDRGMLPQTSYR